MQLLKIRPLGNASIRYTPIFSNGTWHALYFIRMQSYVLSVLCFMEVSISLIQPQLDFFETTLIQARLEIPTEVLL